MPDELAVLYSDRRDRALGMSRPGARTASLLDYRRKRQAQMTRTLAEAAFYKALIDECRAEVRRLVDGADTPEKRREVLPGVERLHELANQAAENLEGLSRG